MVEVFDLPQAERKTYSHTIPAPQSFTVVRRGVEQR